MDLLKCFFIVEGFVGTLTLAEWTMERWRTYTTVGAGGVGACSVVQAINSVGLKCYVVWYLD
ncbi:hypothetical protein CAEBREN_29306 [Caenorhabditis brenneri]|uniref:Uncharacterized protein n=1 Tax=Caenorhabditis brenneri TaxID=135651 RepID=G0MQJ9_CAEBE|nr:hypothetical protein CAEBREN_29306 [Caenorhabditis brenneri]